MISLKEVEYLAKLSRLRFSKAEIEKLSVELGAIVEYMAKLNELDTSGVEPLSHPVEIVNVMREDVAKPSLPPREALANAPATENGFLVVPKVIK